MKGRRRGRRRRQRVQGSKAGRASAPGTPRSKKGWGVESVKGRGRIMKGLQAIWRFKLSVRAKGPSLF